MEKLFDFTNRIATTRYILSTAFCCTIDNVFVPFTEWLTSNSHYPNSISFYTKINLYGDSGLQTSQYATFFEGGGNYCVHTIRKKVRNEDRYLRYKKYINSMYTSTFDLLVTLVFNSKDISLVEEAILQPYHLIDKSLFTVMISNDILKEEHQDLYKNFEKLFLSKCREQGYNIFFTKDINRYFEIEAKVDIPSFEDEEVEEAYLNNITSLLYDPALQERTIAVFDSDIYFATSREFPVEEIQEAESEEDPTETLPRSTGELESVFSPQVTISTENWEWTARIPREQSNVVVDESREEDDTAEASMEESRSEDIIQQLDMVWTQNAANRIVERFSEPAPAETSETTDEEDLRDVIRRMRNASEDTSEPESTDISEDATSNISGEESRTTNIGQFIISELENRIIEEARQHGVEISREELRREADSVRSTEINRASNYDDIPF